MSQVAAHGQEVLELDVELYRQALLHSASALAYTVRGPRPSVVDIGRALAGSDEPLRFEHEAEIERLKLGLMRAGKAYGLANELAESLAREVLQLVRFFSGVTGAANPRVELSFADGVPRQPRSAASMTLVAPLLGAMTLTETPGASGQVVALYKGDASDLSPVPVAVAASSASTAAARDLWLTVSTEETPYFLVDAPAVSAAPVEQRDVVLVSMPFGPLHQASLGLSLLAASLDARISSEILYFTLAFAERIGTPVYAWITNSNPKEEALTGEWIFNRALFGDRAGDDRGYIDEILASVPACEIEDVLRARRKTESFLDWCVAEVVKRAPKMVGFTSVFNQQVPSLALAKRLKEALPEVTIVLGGANCEGMMGVETVRQFEFVDAVVSGEGDKVFADLVESVLAGRGIPRLPGVYTRLSVLLSPGKPINAPLVEVMDELPEPDFSDFFKQWQSARFMAGYRPRLMFESARGCWWGAKHHCTFCGLNGSGMRFRSKSGIRALDELRRLVGDHPDCTVCVVDNILDMKYFKDFVPELAKSKLPVQLFYETKANLKKNQIAALRAAGITTIQPGVESFGDQVLELMRKGVSALQNVQLLKWCAELGVWPFWNVLWGFPGESPSAYEDMAALIPWLHHLPPPVAGGILRLDRFSPNFESSDELGFENVRPFPSYGHIYPFPPEALANLAYYFDYDYQDGRDPQTYTAGVAAALAAWKESFDGSHLIYIDKGSNLILWDTRAAARKQITILDATARAVYLECDGVITLSKLRGRVARATGTSLSMEELEAIIAPLVRDGQMLRSGAQVLGIAIPQPGQATSMAHPAAAL